MATPSGVLAAVSERPRELFDDLDLRDRAEELTDGLQKRSKDLRKRSAKAAKQTRRLTAEAVDLAGDVRERIGDPRERVEELRHAAIDASENARDRAEDLEPVLRKLAIDVLTAFRGLIGIAMVLPRLVVRGLGVLADLADRAEVAREKGHEFAERARDAAHSVPPSKRMRWRRRGVNAILLGTGFAIGFAIGWIAAQRTIAELEEDEQVEFQPVGERLRSVREDGSQPEPEAGTGA